MGLIRRFSSYHQWEKHASHRFQWLTTSLVIIFISVVITSMFFLTPFHWLPGHSGFGPVQQIIGSATLSNIALVFACVAVAVSLVMLCLHYAAGCKRRGFKR